MLHTLEQIITEKYNLHSICVHPALLIFLVICRSLLLEVKGPGRVPAVNETLLVLQALDAPEEKLRIS